MIGDLSHEVNERKRAERARRLTEDMDALQRVGVEMLQHDAAEKSQLRRDVVDSIEGIVVRECGVISNTSPDDDFTINYDTPLTKAAAAFAKAYFLLLYPGRNVRITYKDGYNDE